MIERINEQLELMERELSKMKSVTEYSQATNENSVLILSELKELHQKYAEISESLFRLYTQAVEDVQTSTATTVAESVSNLTKASNQLEGTRQKISEEIQSLLENHQDTIDSTNHLIQNLETLNLKNQFQDLIQHINQKNDQYTQCLIETQESLKNQIAEAKLTTIQKHEILINAIDRGIEESEHSLTKKLSSLDTDFTHKLKTSYEQITQELDNTHNQLIKKLDAQDIQLNQYKLMLYGIIALSLLSLIVGFIR